MYSLSSRFLLIVQKVSKLYSFQLFGLNLSIIVLYDEITIQQTCPWDIVAINILQYTCILY